MITKISKLYKKSELLFNEVIWLCRKKLPPWMIWKTMRIVVPSGGSISAQVDLCCISGHSRNWPWSRFYWKTFNDQRIKKTMINMGPFLIVTSLGFVKKSSFFIHARFRKKISVFRKTKQKVVFLPFYHWKLTSLVIFYNLSLRKNSLFTRILHFSNRPELGHTIGHLGGFLVVFASFMSELEF